MERGGLADEMCLSTELPTAGVCESKLNIKITLACPGVQSGYRVGTDWIFPAECVSEVVTHSRYKELLVVGVRMGIGGLNGWGQHHEVCVCVCSGHEGAKTGLVCSLQPVTSVK